MAIIKVTNLDGSVSEVDMNEAVVVHGVDAGGGYLGLVAPGANVRQVPEPPLTGTWNWTGAQWLQTYTLAELQKTAWKRIKVARDVAEFSGFTWNSFVFDSDQISQSRVQGGAQLATLASLASLPFTVPWTLQNNTAQVLSGPDMIAVGKAMGTHIMTTHAIGRTLRASIEAATTKTQLDAISWP